MNIGRRLLAGRHAVRLCAAVLFVAAVLTLPLAASKYAAAGEGAAIARVAKWEVEWDVKGQHLFGGTYVNPGAFNLPFTVDITNKSEVAIRGYFQPMMVGVDENSDAQRPTTYPLGEYNIPVGIRTMMTIPGQLKSITMRSVAINATELNVPCQFVVKDAIKTQKTVTTLGDDNTLTAGTDYLWEAYRVNFDVAAVQID